jgi:hypothetical protein
MERLIRRRPEGEIMLGLRFYACDRCGTVHADLTAPERCHRCHDGPLREITGRLQADSYFAPPTENDL